MIRIQKILVPIDFSENSEKAILYGVEIARDRKARLYLLHVVDKRLIEAVEELGARGYQNNPVQVVEEMILDREKALSQLIPDEWREGLEIEFLIRRGRPADQVIKMAKESLIDLIVIGTRGHSGIASSLLGSVSQKIVHHGPCPVLIVRPKEHDFVG